ncbi:MAG: glutathione synthase, partial [Gammaproteobacteria bacterium]|nr:glutathione synthase [Gammaproteobacteria bacterium]
MPPAAGIAVLMDPVDQLHPAKDSTIAMLRAAARRGCPTWYFEQHDLWVRDGRAEARLHRIEVTGASPP